MRIVQLIVALALSQGWNWAKLAQDMGYLQAGTTAQFLAGGSITLLFLAQQLTLSIRQPASRTEVREKAAIVDIYLKHLLADYYAILAKRGGGDKPIVRANVMLPVVDLFRCRKRLQICYKACPDGIKYNRGELDLFWKKGIGVVGWVWDRGQSETYSRSAPSSQEAEASLTPEQRAISEDVDSILSVPIMIRGKPVGVLNLDGQEDIDRTLFDSDEVKELVTKCAGTLHTQCFVQGVKKR